MSKAYDSILGKVAAEAREARNGLADLYNRIEAEQPDRQSRAREQARLLAIAKAQQPKLHAKFEAMLREKRAELERRAFGAAAPEGDEELPPGTPAPAEYLKAVEAVADLNGKALVSEYDRAERYGDRAKMSAIARRAIETGNNALVDRYAATDERFRENAKEYAEFSQRLHRKGRAFYDGAMMRVGEPYKIATEQVEAGRRVVDAHGTTAPVYDTRFTWASTPKEHPTLGGTQESHESMAKAWNAAAGRKLTGGPPLRAFPE